jgi:CRP/FNR family transcriptional regulator, cyclic AMP receptor protein
MSVRAEAETFRQVPIFRDCDSVPLQIMAFAAERQEFAIGEDIITQSKKARAAFFILNGHVALRDAGKDIGVAEPGSLLGEVAMISSGVYSISATAREVVSTARITHELFLRVAKEYPEFGQQVLNNLSDKLESSMRELDGVRILLNKSRSFADL